MDRDHLAKQTVAQLRSLAAHHKLPGRSRMRKAELVAALAELQPRRPDPIEPPVEARPGDASSSVQATPPPPAQEGPDPGLPIPAHYGQDRLVLMAQDPHHLFAYWELSGEALAEARGRLGEDGTAVLLVHSGEGVEQREVDLLGGNYYLSVAPGARYRGELALRGSDGRLVPVAASSEVTTPAAGPSDRVDEEWMAVDETFDELLLAAGLPGSGGSSATMADQRVRARLWNEAVAGPGLPPGSSEHLAGLPSSYTSSTLSSWSHDED